jgi:TolB-like protein/Flp pilus assembly protein TadD
MSADFRVGEWLVRPSLNTISTNGIDVQVEPKVMEVLVCLASRPSESISKEAIIKAVWPDTFVSDDALIRCISELRRVFEDDARAPAVIQTIPKRGYRLLIPAVPIGRVNHQEVHSTLEVTDSIAVLPFESDRESPETEYLAEGVAESIINSLAQVQRLRVVPRTTAFRYKGKRADARQAGRELRVRVVVTGHIVLRGDEAIVSVDLTDVIEEAQLWGKKYRWKIADILAVEEQIGNEISHMLRLRLSDEERRRLAKRATQSNEAHHLVLRARYYANKWTPEGIRKGLEFARQAIEADPVYADAHTVFAYLYCLVGIFGGLAPIDAFPRAKAAALQALEIDDGLAIPHATLAMVRLFYDWDFKGAETECRRAVELGPYIAGCHHAYSHWHLAQGLFEEAKSEAKQALDLDPLSMPLNFHLGATYYFARQYDDAIDQLVKTIEMDPSFAAARGLLSVTYARKGMSQVAVEEAEKIVSLSGDVPRYKTAVGIVNAMVGKLDEARNILGELEQASHNPKSASTLACSCAVIHAFLGDREQAFVCLERAYKARASSLVYVAQTPDLSSLHEDPRFNDLLRRMGFAA